MRRVLIGLSDDVGHWILSYQLAQGPVLVGHVLALQWVKWSPLVDSNGTSGEHQEVRLP